MSHTLIVGMSQSGKTTLAKHLCASLRNRGIKTIVLDPLSDPEWRADFVTASNDEFLSVAKRSKSCALFIEEAGQTVGRYAREMEWATTQARHWGHISFVSSQRAVQISQTVRDQCTTLYCFKVSLRDSKTLTEDWLGRCSDELCRIPQYHFYRIRRFGEKPNLMTLKI